MRGTRANSPILVDLLTVHRDHRRKGYGSALMDTLQDRYPKAKIQHGDRTNAGKAWWKSYGQGADRRGRTGSRPFELRYQEESDAHAVYAEKNGQQVGSLHWWKHDMPPDMDVPTPSPHDHDYDPDEYCDHCQNVGHDYTLHDREEGQVAHIDVHPHHRRQGIGTAMWEHAHNLPVPSPRHSGWQTSEGKEWAKKVGFRPGRICAACGGIGEDETGSECSLCDGSGRNPECSCGEGVELHPQDGWQHLDGSVSHGDRPESVSDLVHQRIGRTTPEMIQRAASFRPTKRIFGPTYGLDHRLFSRRKMRPDVRKYVLGTLDGFWRPLYGPDWQSWARVYLAGSEASEWTGPDLEGNNDFDILVGVHYDACRAVVPQFARFTDQDITDKLNADFRGQLIPRTDPVTITVDGKPVGPLSNTWYCNMASWDIKDIRPYAAYDITNDRWAVTPPHLPEWSIDAFPAGHAMIDMGEAYDALVKAILSLPEPYRTQQGNALWEHLHSDRARAFSPQGEGWYDPGNVIEKWLDQEGVWQDLWDIHHRAQTDPTTLLAPAGWSNDPKG
jgi:GNAT superfamily N-acetyltransferase